MSKPGKGESPGRHLDDKWFISYAAGWWWAECPDAFEMVTGVCACEAFATHAEAVAHTKSLIKRESK